MSRDNGRFSCNGRAAGYYADISSGCQVYHMCDGIGRRFTYACPNATLFQQRMLICDHWYMVDCSTAERDYSANLRIGRQGPFVEDGEMAGMRTPRPDLLTASADQAERELVYRISKDQTFTPKNTVGLDTENINNKDQTYFPPTYWATDHLSGRSTTVLPKTIRDNKQFTDFYKTSYNTVEVGDSQKIKAKAIDFNSLRRQGNNFEDVPNKSKPSNIVQINFKSNFKATTPVYPNSVEDTTSSPNNIGLKPPKLDRNSLQPNFDRLNSLNHAISNENPQYNFESNFKATTPVYPSREQLAQQFADKSNTEEVIVNFGSKFKATTPVYPNEVDSTSPNPTDVGLLPPKDNSKKISKDPVVNFVSNFKATTPDYPTSVDPTSLSPDEVGLVAPNEKIVEEKPVVNFASNFTATTPVYPTSVESTSPNPDEFGLLAPKENKNYQEGEQQRPIVNFDSNFKATTPVYPTSVDSTSPNPDEIGLLSPKNNKVNQEIVNSIPIVNFASSYEATTPDYPKSVESTSPNPADTGLLPPKKDKTNEFSNRRDEAPIVNFVSNFKATTPVYPTYVDATSPNPVDTGLLPPKQNREKGKPVVNYPSNFIATTPVYPLSVDATSSNPSDAGLVPPEDSEYNQLIAKQRKGSSRINFVSKFKATTPVYPISVDPTSPNPIDVGLLPPEQRTMYQNSYSDQPAINLVSNIKTTTSVDNIKEAKLILEEQSDLLPLLDLLPPKLDDNYKADKGHLIDIPIAVPSKFYQPPNYEPDYTDENPGLRIANFMKSFNNTQWQELRTAFHIPEYDFPLDDATRPSYDSVLDSFDPIPVNTR